MPAIAGRRLPMKRLSFVVVLLTFWSLLATCQLSSNFNACRYGYASCDLSRLTKDEQAQVGVAAQARNFNACRYGYASCDSSRLTTDEQGQVAVAAQAHNFNACRYGFATCNRALLTPDESARISSGESTITTVPQSGIAPAGVAENG